MKATTAEELPPLDTRLLLLDRRFTSWGSREHPAQHPSVSGSSLGEASA